MLTEAYKDLTGKINGGIPGICSSLVGGYAWSRPIPIISLCQGCLLYMNLGWFFLDQLEAV